MKSSFELAMDRLSKQSPTVKLTQAQKSQIAEIDSLYKARLAEREIFLQGERDHALEKGDADALAQIERQIGSERRRLETECEEKKDKIRTGA